MTGHDANGIPLTFGTVEGGATFNPPPPPVPVFTMADVHKHRRMCTGKRKRFHTAVEGNMYLIRRKFRQMRLYPCPYCSGFHMSSKP